MIWPNYFQNNFKTAFVLFCRLAISLSRLRTCNTFFKVCT